MIEVKPNQVYTVDVDGTLCNSSKEFARWERYCITRQCERYSPAGEDKHVSWCDLGSKRLCPYEKDVSAQGIFTSESLASLPLYPQSREFLRAVEKERTAGAYIVTGRPEKQREATLDWIERRKLPIFYMLMREAEDTRAAPEVKREIFNRLRLVYGTPEQTWIAVDDDGCLAPVCEELGMTFIKAPECWE